MTVQPWVVILERFRKTPTVIPGNPGWSCRRPRRQVVFACAAGDGGSCNS